MDRRQAVALSATAHGGLIAYALIAGLFHAKPPDDNLQVAAVSVISTSEFEALVSAAPAPADPQPPAPATPVEPPPQETAPPPPTDSPAPEPAPRPDTPAPATPDIVPDAAIAPPPPVEAVTPRVPDQPEEPPADVAEAPDAPVSDTPAPRAADIVSTTPTPAPPPLTEAAPTVQAAPSPAEPAEPVEPAETTAAPEQTAPVIVREDEVAASAPERSARPDRRPARPIPVVAQPQVATETPATPEPAAPDAATAPTNDALADAIAGAVADAISEPAAAPPAPSGPPLTQGDRDGLRIAVSRCWNIGSLSTEAVRTTVTIYMEINRDGVPRTDTIRLAGYDGGSQEAAQQAFEAGRRAIFQCGRDGFDLPLDKYEQWKEVEMTFNPDQMRLR